MSVASSAAVGPPPGMAVRLSSNESPFGPSARATAAAAEVLAEAHLYPDDQSVALRQTLAAHLGCRFEEVAVGTGSAALLMDAVPQACAGADDAEVLAFDRSFVVYQLAARNAAARYVQAPTGGPPMPGRAGYERDVDALLSQVTDATRVVVIDNPGNPTGAHLTGADLETLVNSLPERVTVIVDEAYHEFATGLRGYATVAELGLEHPRLLTLRTFSKAYALAGLRVGYITGPAGLVAELDARRTRFNVTAPAQAAAIAALADTEHLARTVTGTREGRVRMAAGLADLGVSFTDGLGNFLTIELGRPSGAVVDAFAERGIGVRALAPYGMDQQIRVSVGTPVEVETFLDAAGEILKPLVSPEGTPARSAPPAVP